MLYLRRHGMKLTPARRRALEIVRDNPDIGPTQFARLMWPDSKGHTRESRRHDGIAGARGAGIKMSAGAFLGRLADDRLLSTSRPVEYAMYRSRYSLSEAGRRALDG